MSKRCPECHYRMEHDGVVDNDDVYYCDVCGIYQSYPLEEEDLLAAEGKNCGCGKDPCVTYGAESEKKLKMVSSRCLSCGNDRANIDHDGDKFCYDCYHYAETFDAEEKCPMPDHEGKKCGKGLYSSRLSPRPSIGRTTRGMMICGDCAGLESYAKGLGEWVDRYPNRRHDAETFNSYKVAPELSSYTVDELVASKAGPQGSASYDEMVYDPIAQNRLSAESVSIPLTLLLIGSMVAGLGFGVFLTKNLKSSTPETSDEGGA